MYKYLCLFLLIFISSTIHADVVILVHGLGRTKFSMKKIEHVLKKEGYKVENIGYPSHRYPVEVLAKNYLIPSLKKHEHENKIHIITHSMGGIITRYALDRNTPKNLGYVIMLSPPNKGSEIVDQLGKINVINTIQGPAFSQLQTNSLFLETLKDPSYSVGIIAGTQSMNPLLGSLIEGDHDGKVSIASAKIEGFPFIALPVTHTWMMFNKQVINNIMCFIKTGKFISEG